MLRLKDMASLAAGAAVALSVAACSSGNPLTTGTLLGGSSAQAPAAPRPETPADRSFHVGSTAARAQRCGYVFDPAGVRQGYLAFEAQQGVPPTELAKIEQGYDRTVAAVAKSISDSADYCSDDQTAAIKRDLGQVLAGNYASPTKRGSDLGWWNANRTVQPMDREKLFNPTVR